MHTLQQMLSGSSERIRAFHQWEWGGTRNLDESPPL
jgi:hypothetical protein